MAKTGSSYLREAAYLPSIVGVAALSDFLRLLFDDGTAGDVDFSDEVWESVLETLREPVYFAKVRVDPEAGTVTWPKGEDLAPEPLYEQAQTRALTPSREAQHTVATGRGFRLEHYCCAP